MPEPERQDNPEGRPKSEEEQQEITELLKRQYLKTRADFVLPGNLINAFGAYLLFVYTVTTIGNYAYTSDHKITSEIIFYSLPLFVLAPIAYLVYLKSRKKTRQKDETTEGTPQRLIDRFTKSLVGRFFLWLGTSRIGRILMVTSYIYNIADAIRAFPRHPRYSLATIVFCLAFLVWLMLMIYVEAIEKRLDRRIALLWDTQKDMLDISKTLIAEIKTLDDLVSVIVTGFNQHLTDMAGWLPLNQESHEATNTALQMVHKLVLTLDDKVNLLKEPPSDPPSEGRRKTRK
jgi:hypothetical protein